MTTTATLTMAERVAHLRSLHETDRICSCVFESGERVCLLLGLAPDIDFSEWVNTLGPESRISEQLSLHIGMPTWMGDVLVSIDDAGFTAEGEWHRRIARTVDALEFALPVMTELGWSEYYYRLRRYLHKINPALSEEAKVGSMLARTLTDSPIRRETIIKDVLIGLRFAAVGERWGADD